MNGQLYPARTIIFVSDQAIDDFIYSCQFMAIGKTTTTKLWKQCTYDLISDIFRMLEPSNMPISRIVLKKDWIEGDIAVPKVWIMSWFSDGILMNAFLTFKGNKILVQSGWDTELGFKVVVNNEGKFVIK